MNVIERSPCTEIRSLEAARLWVREFMAWYNEEHRHSRIRFVTPAQRYRGEDKAMLAKREQVYQVAHPSRWTGKTRNWQSIGAVTLNPERPDQELKDAA